jgi:large subunit ribosomal protein L18
MAHRKPKTVLYRRKRENRTDYKKRLHLLLSRKTRLVIRFTNQKVIAQMVNFTTEGDKVVIAVDSSFLKKQGWLYSLKNMPAAYLTGLSIGKKAQSSGVKEAVLDTGFKTPMHKGKTYAFLKGVVDSGLNIPHDGEKIFPSEERISGKHVQDYAKILGEKGAEKSQFTKYLKNNSQPGKMVETFEKIKQELMS